MEKHPRRRFGTLVAALLLAAAGCGRGSPPPAATPRFAGATLVNPVPKPEFVLTGTDGKPYDFRRETDGYVTLLFFGYTNCPDVCPVHMANLGAVLPRLPFEVSRRIKVVFVTTDPARDTPARLRSWLDNFDSAFVGLTGSPEALRRAQIAAGITPAVPDSGSGGKYGVSHAAQVMAYTADNLGRVMYPFGVRQADWAHDLPLLVQVASR